MQASQHSPMGTTSFSGRERSMAERGRYASCSRDLCSRDLCVPPYCPTSAKFLQVYEGYTYKLPLKFPTSYPYEAPQVTFITPCFHPNVDQYGNICLDILKVSLRSPFPGSSPTQVNSERRPPPQPLRHTHNVSNAVLSHPPTLLTTKSHPERVPDMPICVSACVPRRSGLQSTTSAQSSSPSRAC